MTDITEPSAARRPSEVKYEGQESVTLQVGDYAYGPAEKPHWATCHSSEDCVLFIAFEEPVDAMPSEE